MAASLKMFQFCKNCLKCSILHAKTATNQKLRQSSLPQWRRISTTCVCRSKESNSSNGNDGGADKDLKTAAKQVTKKIKGEDREEVMSTLMKKLRAIGVVDSKSVTKTPSPSTKNPAMKEKMQSVLDRMHAVKGKPKRSFMARDERPVADRKFERKATAPTPSAQVKPFKLFEGERLGIFDPEIMKRKDPPAKETLWDIVEREELDLVMDTPRNGFEEMMMWTKQGKMWEFPIDNEQGWESEQKTEFHEHVFLDHLIDDFPKQGPLRHFMELVVIGLSKNPILTAQQKREHIQWFREYFLEKQDILIETLGESGGKIDVPQQIESASS